MSDTEAHDQLAEARGRIAARDWEGALAALAEAEGRAPETWFLRGVAREALGDHERAGEAYRRALELAPEHFEAHHNLGNVLCRAKRFDAALAHYRSALRLRPEDARALSGAGTALAGLGRSAEAIAMHRGAVALDPARAEAHNNLGLALRAAGRLDEAAQAFAGAVERNPALRRARLNLADARVEQRRFDEALAGYDQVLREADSARAWSGKGSALLRMGRADEAIAAIERANAPQDLPASSQLLFAMQCAAHCDPEARFAAHRRWGESIDRLFAAQSVKHVNSPETDRKLRVGYVSGDFRAHTVADFLLPVFAAHDRERFKLVCYHNAARADALTAEFRRLADAWRETARLSDDEFAALVRDDAIDLLVDLSGHTEGHRLEAFARRPAPVQMTYLGYLATTGLESIDLRITDAALDPPGVAERWHSERVARLPTTLWCFAPPSEAPGLAPLPADANGYVTFGSFNNFAKASARAVAAWADILSRVPSSRFLALAVPRGSAGEGLRARFAAAGVGAERLWIRDRVDHAEFLRTLAMTDIALDSFPYTGGATTCEALWMGVPVVTRAGLCGFERSAASILHALGLEQFAAPSDEQYVEIAVALAGDRAALAELRAGLRERLRAGPLTDARRFTAELEAVYRNAWRAWCASRQQLR